LRSEVITLRYTAKWRILATAVKDSVAGLGKQPSVRRHAFTTETPLPLQFDGELMDLPAGATVRVDIASRAVQTVSDPLTPKLAPAFAPSLRSPMPAPDVDDPSIISTSHQAAPDHPKTAHPLVAFVPGLGLDADEWQAVRAGLTGASVVVLLPSLGQPAPRPADLRTEAHASRLLESLPTGTPTILVGHSASCPVVVNAAARSDDVVGLVLVGPVTDPAAQSWPRMLRQWGRTAAHERPSEAASLARQYRRTGPMSMLRGMNAVRGFRTDLALESLTLPVEIVRGRKDRIATQDWCSELKRAANGRLTTVEGAAHMVPLTHPEAVVAAVDRVRAATPQQTQPVVT
jgi:pimeloyl-ACP methyl ester carboxylesterase